MGRRAEVFGLADRLRALAAELEGHAGQLRLRTGAMRWEGEAANAFRRRIRRRVGEALLGADGLRAAAAALERYARGLALPAGEGIAR
jgi:hypothetical protein